MISSKHGVYRFGEKLLAARRRYLRLLPFPTNTPEGRTNERYRRAVLTTVSNVPAKVITLAGLLVSTYIALPYLGPERFGVWITIGSITGVLSVVDLGIGNALVSRVAAQVAAQDRDGLRTLISGGLQALTVLGLVVGVGLALIAWLLPLELLFKGLQLAAEPEIHLTLVLFAALFAASMPLLAVHRILAGLQQGYLSHAAVAATGLVSLALLPLVPIMGGGIPAFLLVTYGLYVSSGLLLLRRLYTLDVLTWRWQARFAEPHMRGLITAGGLFFGLQIAVVLGWAVNPALLAALVGPSAVAQYAVCMRLFALVSLPVAMFNNPLWGSYADAHALGDRAYIRGTLRTSLMGTALAAVIGCALMLVLLEPAVDWLGQGEVIVPWTFATIFAAWIATETVGTAFAMYLNGVHLVRPQLITSLVFVLLSLPLKLFLVPGYGLEALAAITLGSYLLAVPALYATRFRREIFAPLRAA